MRWINWVMQWMNEWTEMQAANRMMLYIKEDAISKRNAQLINWLMTFLVWKMQFVGWKMAWISRNMQKHGNNAQYLQVVSFSMVLDGCDAIMELQNNTWIDLGVGRPRSSSPRFEKHNMHSFPKKRKTTNGMQICLHKKRCQNQQICSG